MELYDHNNPDNLTAQPVASTPRLSAVLSTKATVSTSSSSTVTSCSSNVSAPSPSWNSSGTDSSPPPPRYESAQHLPPDFISFTMARLQSIDWLLTVLICLCILCLLFLKCSFVFYFFIVCWFLVFLLHGWNHCSSTFFSWFPPCCPCLVLVTEMRCRTDGSNIQLLLSSYNHLHVDLISVPPYTPTWN